MKKLAKYLCLTILFLSSSFIITGCKNDSEPATTIYSITVQPSIGGDVILDKSLAIAGEEVEITILPEYGYALKFIMYNNILIEGNTFIMPAQNVTVSARFGLLYDIEISPCENGEVKLDKTQTYAGDTVIISPQPKEGYYLSNLIINGQKVKELTLNEISFTMPNKNITIEATFSLKSDN